MKCCDDYGNCDQGRDCPIRYACAVEADLRRGVRWDRIVGAWLWAALIVVLSLIIFGVI
jgi:hypothetical protein